MNILGNPNASKITNYLENLEPLYRGIFFVASFVSFTFGVIFSDEYITSFCRFFNNAYYAKVGGVSTAELNRLEMKFLFSIDFRLQVPLETFGRYCSLLERETTEGLQIERPYQACGIKETWSNKDDSSCAPTVAR